MAKAVAPIPMPFPNKFACIFGPQAVHPEIGVPSERKNDKNGVVRVGGFLFGSKVEMVWGAVMDWPFGLYQVQTASRSDNSLPSSSQPTATLPLLAMVTPRLSVWPLLMVVEVFT